MFSNTREKNDISNQFVIVFSDKLTKKSATALYEEISQNRSTIKAVIWTYAEYKSNRHKISSTNRIVAIGKELAQDFVPNPNHIDSFNAHGIHIRIKGSNCHIYADPINDIEFSNLEKEINSEFYPYKNVSVASQQDILKQGQLEKKERFKSYFPPYRLYKYLEKKKDQHLFQYFSAVSIFEKAYLEKFISNDE